MVRQQSRGIRLPQSILDEINGTSAEQSRGRGYGSKSKLSRKEARKQEREGRKQKKAQYFSNAHNVNAVKRRAEDDHLDSPRRKRVKTESGAAPPAPAARVRQQDADATSSKEKASTDTKTTITDKKPKEKKAKDFRKPSALAKLAGETSKKSSKATPRSRVEADEDNYIAYLESKLGLKGGKKKKSNPEEDDGLDDLLDFASKFDSFDGAAEAEVRFQCI
ncbi:uncharacterized protein SCHCODRAFT_02501775 [Schizophyllum commune H4-8]|uniref:uncharacterized protein n=1 Tax=Schizophyllum commune (strain H4-8 / FGSC 9210) TaxID=578458 RepID=UPI00215FE1F8|nr:uncharacterized protein SCHCODRAFT_02501775 [Schizophyllum commune H4-8]KAI5892846.1 hypothetical protein SCHCODRAFT_02501775 [Schizophyllum commune H4-8]